MLGEVEEIFRQYAVTPGDTFMFAGQAAEVFAITGNDCAKWQPAVRASRKCRPMKAARMPLTTNLADRVRAMLHDPG